MEIVQKKKSNKHTFKFMDDHFNFAYVDSTGSDDTDLNYADIPKKSSTQIEQNEWLRNVGYLWCVLGIFDLGFAIYSQAPISGKGFWLLLGLVCIAWANFSKVKYSVFKTERGNVFVIDDKNHDKIIDELMSRKKTQLLNWYGEVNPENDLEQEISKFKWLVEQNVLSEEESEKKIAQAQFLDQQESGLPSERLN